jgi:hypothetical protein
MRSCLIQFLILVVVGFALLWFGLPVGAGWLATNALNSSGFSGTDTKVVVSANPPPLLLTGQADTVHLTSTQVGIGDLHAASIDLTLGKVDLLGRKIGTVAGNLEGVRVAAPDGQAVTVQSVTLSGAASRANAELVLSSTEVERLAQSQLESRGVAGTVSLAAPDKVTISAGGQSIPGRLAVQDGGLTLVPDSKAVAPVPLIVPGSGNPFHITSVSVGAATVTMDGNIDLQALLGI